MSKSNTVQDKQVVLDAEEIKEIVAEQLGAARKLRGLTLRQAALRLGISPSYLSQMEKTSRNISLEVLFKASKVYKVSVDVLLGREPIPGSTKGRRVFDMMTEFFRQPFESRHLLPK